MEEDEVEMIKLLVFTLFITSFSAVIQMICAS